MADGRLKVNAGKLLVSAAAKFATADNCCCNACLGCPDGLPTSYTISFRIIVTTAGVETCNEIVTETLTGNTEEPCVWNGDFAACGGGDAAIHVTLGTVVPGEPCRWAFIYDPAGGDGTSRTGTDPTGAYPDLFFDFGGGDTTLFTDIVVS